MQRTTKPLGIQWEQIEELLKAGWPARDIAIRLGCSYQNVRERINRHRASLQKNGAPAVDGGSSPASESA